MDLPTDPGHPRRIIVVGATPSGAWVSRALNWCGAVNSEVVGMVAPTNGVRLRELAGVPVLADAAVLADDQLLARADQVVWALEGPDDGLLNQIRGVCARNHVDFAAVPDVATVRASERADVADLERGASDQAHDALPRGLPWQLLAQSVASRQCHGCSRRRVKRLLDVGLAATVLLLTSPLAVLIALAVRLTSVGPVLFTQDRVGKDGRVFRMLKFRSMHLETRSAGADNAGTVSGASASRCTTRSDPRLTPVGRLLRRFSLDEYPQLLNVVLGQMSIVGPRPHVPAEVAHYSDWQRRRLEVLPGLTGLAQVTGRKDLSVGEMLALDVDYVVSWSLGLDLKILLRTVPMVVRGEGAY